MEAGREGLTYSQLPGGRQGRAGREGLTYNQLPGGRQGRAGREVQEAKGQAIESRVGRGAVQAGVYGVPTHHQRVIDC